MYLLWLQDIIQAKNSSNKNKSKMKYLAEITVSGDIEKLYNCLLPEMHETERSSLLMEKADSGLKIKVHAKDAVALRAMLNSTAQMLSIFETTGKIND